MRASGFPHHKAACSYPPEAYSFHILYWRRPLCSGRVEKSGLWSQSVLGTSSRLFWTASMIRDTHHPVFSFKSPPKLVLVKIRQGLVTGEGCLQSAPVAQGRLELSTTWAGVDVYMKSESNH